MVWREDAAPERLRVAPIQIHYPVIPGAYRLSIGKTPHLENTLRPRLNILESDAKGMPPRL